jgi:integrase
MRNGELNALLWSDVDLEKRRIIVSKSYNTRTRSVKSTKSGSWRTIPISNQLYEVLIELKATANEREHVLPRLTEWNKGEQARILRMFCTGAGLPSIRFHTLRACFATQLLANDIAPVRVMKICGWKDFKTMQHYIRMAGIDEKGATECLKILSLDEEAAGVVVNLLDFKSRKNS